MIAMELAIEHNLKMPLHRSRVNIDVIKTDLCRTDMEVLDYANSKIGNLEALFLAARFFVNKSVVAVNLQNNNIGNDGVKMLAESLKDQMTVRRLDMGGNSFGYVGILALEDLKTVRPDIEICGVDLSQEAILQAQREYHMKSLQSGNYADARRTSNDGEEECAGSLWSEDIKSSRGAVLGRR